MCECRGGSRIPHRRRPLSARDINIRLSVADPGGQGGHVKLVIKKMATERQLHRFRVSWPPYPATGSATDFAKFSEKLHKTENILFRGAPLDLWMEWTFFSSRLRKLLASSGYKSRKNYLCPKGLNQNSKIVSCLFICNFWKWLSTKALSQVLNHHMLEPWVAYDSHVRYHHTWTLFLSVD